MKGGLTSTEREFFRQVGAFAFGNPFSTDRDRMLSRLIPGAPIERLRRDRRALADVVEGRLARFDVAAVATLSDFTAADRPHLEAAFLYVVYHRYVAGIDHLIERHLASDAELTLPNAAAAIKALVQRGFSEEDAVRSIGFFYQLRRAFYFIVYSLIGDSPSMQQLRVQLWNSVFTYDMRNFSRRLWNRMEDFSELRAAGRMRDDFYYRLCSDVIEVPPLRNRIRETPGELRLLVTQLIERMTGETSDDLVDRVLESLRRHLPKEYAWPGNVRELEQAVRRILLTGHYHGESGRASKSQEATLLDSMREGALNADELVARYCSMLYQRNPNYSEVAGRTGLDRRTVRKHVQRFARQAL